MSDHILIAVKTPVDLGDLNLNLVAGKGSLTQRILKDNIKFIHILPSDTSRIKDLVSIACAPDYRLAYPFNAKKSVEENESLAEVIAKRILDTLSIKIEYALMCVSGISYEKNWRPVKDYGLASNSTSP